MSLQVRPVPCWPKMDLLYQFSLVTVFLNPSPITSNDVTMDDGRQDVCRLTRNAESLLLHYPFKAELSNVRNLLGASQTSSRSVTWVHDSQPRNYRGCFFGGLRDPINQSFTANRSWAALLGLKREYFLTHKRTKGGENYLSKTTYQRPAQVKGLQSGLLLFSEHSVPMMQYIAPRIAQLRGIPDQDIIINYNIYCKAAAVWKKKITFSTARNRNNNICITKSIIECLVSYIHSANDFKSKILSREIYENYICFSSCTFLLLTRKLL